MTDRVTLALDAMGGDHAPHETVRGAVEYARDGGRKVILVGDPAAIERALGELRFEPRDIEVQPASQVIESGEKIGKIRTKRDSSLHVACRLVRDGRAAALVSAGHTGAFMAIGRVILGLIKGVDRPALPAPFPHRGKGYSILIDAGANLDCRPEHFRQFAVMGFHYSRRVFGVENPRVALLGIGVEDSKRNAVQREVASILSETRVNFIGNVEGNDLFADRADVVLCDGFVGNVSLKVAEGLAETFIEELRGEIVKGPLRRLGALPLRPVFRVLRNKLDYREYGGVPLLGLREVAVVAHGRSHSRAIRNALRVAEKAAASQMTDKIARDITMLHETEERLAAASGKGG
ncbi:MAG: phosphate acyltransferase PlsX [Thermoleophilia bacterium]|nr:phosphate acyltransferase PlsX [Thermoleophilia bacterium]